MTAKRNKLFADVRHFLDAIPGAFFFELHDGGVVGETAPDFIGTYQSKFIAVKIIYRTPGIDEAQKKLGIKVVRSGGQYWIIRKFEDLSECARKIGWT